MRISTWMQDKRSIIESIVISFSSWGNSPLLLPVSLLWSIWHRFLDSPIDPRGDRSRLKSPFHHWKWRGEGIYDPTISLEKDPRYILWLRIRSFQPCTNEKYMRKLKQSEILKKTFKVLENHESSSSILDLFSKHSPPIDSSRRNRLWSESEHLWFPSR